MTEHKKHFAERLRESMREVGLPPRPSVLVNAFNLEHQGESITFQTASRWLKGVSLPNAAKIRTLARILGQKPESLLFTVDDTDSENDGGHPVLAQLDREMLDAFLRLQGEHRRLVRSLVMALADKHGGNT